MPLSKTIWVHILLLKIIHKGSLDMYYYYPYYVYDYRQQPDLSQANIKMRSHLSAIQQIPIHSSSFQQSMAAVVKHLQAVSRALALGCGMSSEFRFLPDTWGLRELHIVHAKYLTPLSYHVYSALGAAELLASGQGRAPHFPLMVGCMNSILRLWSNFPAAIADLRRAAGHQYASSVDEAENLLRPMVPATQQALSISQSAVSPAIWQASLRAAQLAREVRQNVAQSMSQGSSY
ncbi:hypothetical protein [Bacillus velezensis]|uniref:hypothetical protein n=1 Tax=Bacillus velezensis TaxID=492670 RepID=UPI0035A70FD5